jgi:hypothetical protein
MNDEHTEPTSGDDLEHRLRHVLASRAEGAPVGQGDWGELASRLAVDVSRRQRLLLGAVALALVIGATGGYVGESVASPSPTGALAARSSPTSGALNASATTQPSGSTPRSNLSGPAAILPCADTTPSGNGLGSATHLFTRSTADGVTVRVYRTATTETGPCPLSGGSGSAGGGVSAGSTPNGAKAERPVTVSPMIPADPVTTDPTTTDPTTTDPTTTDPTTTTTVPTATTTTTDLSTTTTTTEPQTTLPPVFTTGISIELSDADAVGDGVLGDALCPYVPVPNAAGANSGGGTSSTEPRPLSTGAFGVVEGDPVWWVGVEVGSDVAAVKMTFADGSSDEMAPVGGIAVLARRINPATASSGSGPFSVRGTLTLLGADGNTIDSVTLPEQSAVVPGNPGPVVPQAPAAQGESSSSASASSGAIVACPRAGTTTTQP